MAPRRALLRAKPQESNLKAWRYGAAHMVGEDGLVALLEAKGYRVTRLR